MENIPPHSVVPTENDSVIPLPPTERTAPSANGGDSMHQAQDATPLTTMTGPGDLATILDVMRTMMVDRENRQKELAEEMRRQAAERAQERERQEFAR